MASNHVSSAGLHKFDPDSHKGSVYDAFVEYIDAFEYEYDAIAKDPPTGTDPADLPAWIQQNKRKQFLGRFASRNLQKDYEDIVPAAERGTATFETLVTRLKDRYRPTRNTTLANFEFHQLKQKVDESFDMFVNRIKHEATLCEFNCANANCTVRNIMVRDQVIVGTNNDEIRRNALKNQWLLPDLVYQWEAARGCNKRC